MTKQKPAGQPCIECGRDTEISGNIRVIKNPAGRKKQFSRMHGEDLAAPDGPALVPLLPREIPNLREPLARNEAALHNGDEARALLCRDSTRSDILDSFRRAQVLHKKAVEPEVRHSVASLRHEAYSVPGQAEPKASVLMARGAEIDDADVVVRAALETDGPYPLFAAGHRGQRHIPVKLQSPIVGIWPGNLPAEKAHDFPMRKKALRYRRVVER